MTAVRRYLDRGRLGPTENELHGTLVPPLRALLRRLVRRQGTFQRGTASSGTKGLVLMTPVHMSMKSLHPRRTEASQVPHLIEADPHLDPSRDTTGKNKKKQTCKFWKQGRCNRGTECRFSHKGKQSRSPRAATPARPSSSDLKREGSRSPGRGKDRSPRQKGNKGKLETLKASPAAVCLIASMLASVSNACLLPPVDFISCLAVTFNHNCEVYDIIGKGDFVPVRKATRKYRNAFPIDHPFEFDEREREDAYLSASMLAGSVVIVCKCDYDYECDTMFGGDHCIPNGLVAAPAQSEELVDGCFEGSIEWVADTGSAQDLLADHHVPYFSENPIRLITANGESASMKQGKVKVPELNSTVNPYLVPSSPPVLSIGMRCIHEGFDFGMEGIQE